MDRRQRLDFLQELLELAGEPALPESLPLNEREDRVKAGVRRLRLRSGIATSGTKRGTGSDEDSIEVRPDNGHAIAPTQGDDSTGRQSKQRKRKAVAVTVGEAHVGFAKQLNSGYHPGFLHGKLLRELWSYTLSREPYFVHLRSNPVKSRPKIIYGIPNDKGEFGLYRWGQEKRDWARIEPMPDQLLHVVDKIERHFGVRPNHAIATYYINGEEQWIPAHQDKAFSIESVGVETKVTIYNLSLGAVRPFIITGLDCLGEKVRENLSVLAEFPLQPGDLYALAPEINEHFGHCVPQDSTVRDLRVSYVFRNVDKYFVNPVEGYYRSAGSKAHPLPEAPPVSPHS